MKFSYNWIQSHIKEILPSPKEVEQKIIFHAFEVELVEAIGDDTVFDIKVLPDRAGDCFCHYGMAREIAGLFGLTLKPSEYPALPQTTETVAVELQNPVCDRYIAIRIDGVKIGPSSEWVKNKLEAIGQRSINNVVDATNFVLFDSGQPIHAFDTAKIDGGIVVRTAHDGEAIKLLGGEEKVLKETDTVIADYLGALAIAGVKGGTHAEVSEATTSIIVEVAHFDQVAVRKTSRRLNLITDASRRFEAGIAPELALAAAMQVAALIVDTAGGTITAVKDENKTTPTPRTLSFSTTDISRILGTSVTEEKIKDVFDRYHYTYENKEGSFTLSIPSWRGDISGAHDIAEEIGRVLGYETIEAKPLPFTPTIELNPTDIGITAVKAWCLAQGFREVMTYVFRPKGEVLIAYGAKGKDALRSNLSDGLKESYELNRVNAPLLGVAEVKLFEIGTVFFSDKEEVHVAIVDKGTVQELSLEDFIKEKNISLENVSLPHAIDSTTFSPWSTYPFITRDIAVWVLDEAGKRTLLETADAFAKEHCPRAPFLFDEFSKEGRTSVALRFIFQAQDKTLTDAEVSTLFDRFVGKVKEIPGAEVR